MTDNSWGLLRSTSPILPYVRINCDKNNDTEIISPPETPKTNTPVMKIEGIKQKPGFFSTTLADKLLQAGLSKRKSESQKKILDNRELLLRTFGEDNVYGINLLIIWLKYPQRFILIPK